MKAKLIQGISLVLIMLVTGVFWGTWFPLTRSLEGFSAAEFTHIGRVIIANVAMPMSILMPLCLICMLLSIFWYAPRRSLGFYACIAAFLLMIATLVITLSVLVPIDNQLKNWVAGHMPANWEDLRMRWKAFHFFRTVTSVLSFVCFTVAALAGRDGPKV